MALDQYAPCPCGSGKKLKFCKCVDQPQEYEKLLRLIEGGQGLAAMDRIQQLLAKSPNAAWLLALKGEVALQLQEIETFKDTANRFQKLKPDNPLALVMKALAAALNEEPPETIAHYLLAGLGEARETLPSLAAPTVDLLLRVLAISNKMAFISYWADLQLHLNPESQAATELLQDQDVNLTAKVPALTVEDPPGAAWKERLAEVRSLARNYCYAQAETKLKAILRDFPDQPGPLSQLLQAQMTQINQSGAVATARKLAELPEIPEVDRAYYQASALELDSDSDLLAVVGFKRYGVVDSIDEIVQRLEGLEFVKLMPDESAEQIKLAYAERVGDEVPAKYVFTVFDGAIPESDEQSAEAAGQGAKDHPPSVVSVAASVILYGKQTDKPARALVWGAAFPPNQPVFDQLLEQLQIREELPLEADFEQKYFEFLDRGRVVDGTRLPSPDELAPLLTEEFVNLPLRLFEGSTPLQAASEPHLRVKLLGLLSHFEGQQNLVIPYDAVTSIYQRLGLERPQASCDTSGEQMRVVRILDVDRIDPRQLSDVLLRGLALRAGSLGASRVFYNAALAVLERPSLAEDVQMQVMAHSAMRRFKPTLDEKIEHAQLLLGWMEKSEMPVGRVAIELMGMLMQANRPQEAQAVIRENLEKHPEDPYLLTFLRQMVQYQHAGGPEAAVAGGDLASRMQRGAASPAATSSGLVLPGQDPEAAPTQSKLWLPGS